MVIYMSFMTRTKEKLKKEIDAYKYNRQLEKDPDVVRNRLANERANVRAEVTRIKEIKSFEADKKELQDLKNSTGLRGQIKNALGGVRSHLDSVKARQNSGSKSGIRAVNLLQHKDQDNIGPGRNAGAFEIRGAGMHNQSSPKGTGIAGQRMGSGRSLVTSDVGGSGSGGVFGGSTGSAKPKKKVNKGKTIVIKL
jgi:hypothetical protein